MLKRRRSLFGSVLGAVMVIVGRSADHAIITLAKPATPPYLAHGKRTNHPPRKLGRNPGPSRARRYYNKGGKCH